MMEGCDTLLMVGTSFPYSEWLPEPGQARGVQIDIDARLARHPLPDRGQPRRRRAETLRALIPLLLRKEDRSWRAGDRGERRALVADPRRARPRSSADPINPQLVFHELSSRLPDRAILPADSGSATNWWARHLRLRAGMKAALSGTLATMCPAVPYALAAKFAYPDRPVIACLGDGAMQMLGINALIDVAHYQRALEQPAARGARAQQRRPQPGHLGAARADRRPEARGVAGAARLPLRPLRASSACAASASTARRGRRRVGRGARPPTVRSVLEVVTDPEVPPLPPHIRFEQADKLAAALAGGDPTAREIVTQAVKGKLEEFINR